MTTYTVYHGTNRIFDVPDLTTELENKIFYRGQDISFIIVVKTEHAARVIAERQGIDFQSAFDLFVHSSANKALMDPESLLWTESAEFIADMFDEL